ncbi:MAG: hypothetical protein AAF620_16110 [Bacteroidota bacterium]
MTYTLRNFDNDFQIVNSLGWVLIVVSLVFLIIKGMPGYLIFAGIGAVLIWWQIRGKRIKVDTSEKTVKSGSKTYNIIEPIQIYMNKVMMSQNVNSRVSSSNIKAYFYKAYLLDRGAKILLSSNRKEDRDLEKLVSITQEFGITFIKNY